MDNCRHTEWVRHWRKAHGTVVEITDRPHRLLTEMKRPEARYPSLMVLIGNQDKQLALARLRIGNAWSCRKRSHGEIHLLPSSLKMYKDVPIFIADSDIPTHNRLPTACRKTQCHEIHSETLSTDAPTAKGIELTDRTLRRSVLPFADVVCLFVEDVGGINSAMGHIASWIRHGPVSTASFHPKLFLMVNEGQQGATQRAIDGLLSNVGVTAVSDCLSDISILSIPNRCSRAARCRAASAASWQYMRQRLVRSLRDARRSRSCANGMFSAHHFFRFLELGARRVSKAECGPFDFVIASRDQNEVATDLETHMETFIDLFRSVDDIKSIAVPLIASSFVLDHYPPGMHGR